MSANDNSRPFGLPPRTPFSALQDRVAALEDSHQQLELTSIQRLVRVETKVDSLAEMYREDREERRAILLDSNKTHRLRMSSRAKLLTVLVTTIGGVIGAGIAAGVF